MKLVVNVLLCAICFLASVWRVEALTVVNSKHDFSALGGSPCGYCHSVHNGLGGTGMLNPGFGAFPAITNTYSSATRVYKSTLASLNSSDAPLCLACHDQSTIAANANLSEAKTRLDSRPDFPNGYINTDLSNDHPVGFVFDAAQSPTKIKTPLLANVTFGPGRNQMWCSSCHNVHDNTYGNFLVASNDVSALCLDCHIK